jgi:serine-type D-Ala-D-Ala carboxypeptidase/endopeptidase (penicillin-binding protein 4)
MRSRARAAALLATLALLTVAAPAAASPAQVQAVIDRWSVRNPSTSALVWRLGPEGPSVVAARLPDTPRIPASNVKMVTAAGALIALGPDFRFRTRLSAGLRALRAGRVLRGPVYLQGRGDPTLSTGAYARRFLGPAARMGDLARPLRRAGLRVLNGPIVADERFFDRVRTGPLWRASYVEDVTPLSALSTNQNFADDARGRRADRPALAAARRLRAALRRVGIRHLGPLRTGQAPARSRLLASAVSPPLRVIVRQMNPPSDNHIAETLAKDVGAYAGGGGSTAAGTARIAVLLARRGILAPGDRLVDGSGLSRANRLSAATLVRLVAAADRDPTWGRALIGSLAQGGQGTLVNRFLTGPATRRVRAKTGYLRGVSTLSGRVVSRRGVRYAFSLLMRTDDSRISAAKDVQNRVVDLLAAGRADPARARG